MIFGAITNSWRQQLHSQDLAVLIHEAQTRGQAALSIYELSNGAYLPHSTTRLPPFNLAVTLWEGVYEGKHDTWLRWTDADGALLPTGKEGMEHERQRAEHAEQRAAYLEERLRQLEQPPDQRQGVLAHKARPCTGHREVHGARHAPGYGFLS